MCQQKGLAQQRKTLIKALIYIYQISLLANVTCDVHAIFTLPPVTPLSITSGVLRTEQRSS
jgi:hypothetical protein